MNENGLFKPEDVYNFFHDITQVAHPSANQPDVNDQNEDPVREYVFKLVTEGVLKDKNIDVVFYESTATDPGKRVIVLRRPGSAQFASKKPVILQAHMDMVFNPVTMQFPLKMVEDKNKPAGEVWIKANDANGKDSTLGADDGIGVATALAILNDEELKEYPIECLFTVQEETDMGGAQNCDINNLTGTTLLNLDAETLEQIIYGSAGGCETMYSGTVSYREDIPEGYTAVKLSISKLSGGHSGVDINKGKLNAIKVLTRALTRLNKRMTNFPENGDGIGSYDFLLSAMKRTDVIKANAIPAGVKAVIIINSDDKDKFKKDFNTYCDSVRTQCTPPEKKNMEYESVDAAFPQYILDEKSTDTILGILDQLPHGALKMIPAIPDIVEVSTNLYDISIKNINVSISSSNRSSNGLALDTLKKMEINTAKFYGFTVTTDINPYPSWQPNENSELLRLAKGVYEKYGAKSEATVIHAGLECGVLVERFKNEKGCDLDALSIGPTIRDPHTPNESLQVKAGDVETVQSFYDSVKSIIKDIFGSKQS